MKNYIAGVFLCFAYFINAQEVTVLDEYQKPLEMVEIKSKSMKQTVYTDVYGKADITNFKQATDITFSLLGFEKLVFTYEEIIRFNTKVVMTKQVIDMDELVVSATRWKQSKRDVPNRISSISPEQIELQNPQTAADLLETSGGVFIQKSQQGGGSPMIRGFATNRLLYTVDGVRMNNAIFRGGNIQNVISLDPFVMENTEVFFGPGGVIYGSDAIGGVMSFSTLSPELAKEEESIALNGRGVARYSSTNNERTGHFDINIGGEKWASLTSFSYNSYDDLRMGNNNGPDDYLKPFIVERINGVDSAVANPNPLVQNPTGYNQFNIMQKLKYQPNKNWDFNYAFHYSETSEYARFDRLTEVDENGAPLNAVWNYGPQVWMMNNLSASNTNEEGKLFNYLSVRLAHQYFQESRIDRRFNHHRLRTQLEEVTALSLNVDFEKKWKRVVLFYGVEGIRNEVNSNATAININTEEEIAVRNRYPQADWNTASAYANYQMNLTDKMLLQAGGRFTRFFVNADFTNHQPFFPYLEAKETLNNEAVTGSLGWVYNINKKTHISANLSTGFRAPNVDDVGKVFDFTVDNLTVPNPTLEAEYAYSAEINISKIVGSFIKLDGSVFYTFLDNAIVRRPFTVNGSPTLNLEGQEYTVFALQNASFGEVYGFNAAVEMKIYKGLSLSSQFNYQIGEEEMEDGTTTRSRHAAPWFGITRLRYKFKSFEIQLYSVYSGEISAENLNIEETFKPFIYPINENGDLYSPSWYTLNAKMKYNFNKHFTASFGVENITDQRYRTYSSGIAANGLNFIVGVIGRF
jgi:hemoglobin/transferrin/lactoferrin receptor protein